MTVIRPYCYDSLACTKPALEKRIAQLEAQLAAMKELVVEAHDDRHCDCNICMEYYELQEAGGEG